LRRISNERVIATPDLSWISDKRIITTPDLPRPVDDRVGAAGQLTEIFGDPTISSDEFVVVTEATVSTYPVSQTLRQFPHRKACRHTTCGRVWLAACRDHTLHGYLLILIEVDVEKIGAGAGGHGAVITSRFDGALNGDLLFFRAVCPENLGSSATREGFGVSAGRRRALDCRSLV
jgi:hypothetical protein